ncbi:periplasmic chaperone for outer membrane proteins Skp [Flavobacterium resistens]|uniref:OmpH family outer membrane protein n=1 Tax=Flavobacterium resistens TaxID=443612 RepID=A0A521CNV9_9FLAO|nr:OmpH family outer membrane protein [Flavobacterium resistens]MRX66839.1 OmpH family outer membrane protein [Flavobacterium resistens]SMO61139.1 periplasmic chaperone for outer membrane proteins Skp [Flavobacterium resistens]
MRKQFLFLFLALIVANTSQAQTRTTRIGYIDMEYILENVSDYKEATAQLELKAQKWKQEIESKKIEINKLKESLKAEKALLTKELIDERETEIKFMETEMMDYQQKQFGSDGNLIHQKMALAKPIQDQVFTAVQDIAEAKNYDFIFDKSSDLTMLFSNKKFDISDQVIRVLNRTDKREQLTKKQLKDQEIKETRENEIDENPAMADRQKALDEKRAAREKLIEDRRLEQEAKKKEYDDRRKAIQAEREAKKNGTVSEPAKTTEAAKTTETSKTDATAKPAGGTETSPAATEPPVDKAAERQKLYEQRKKELEERRKKIIEEREAAKKAKEAETQKPNTTNN